MSKIPGVGYSPGPGTVFWIWPGSREPAGTTVFNPSAGNPFGTGTAGTLDEAVFNARYGGRPRRADGTIANLVIDAETVLGLLTRAMEVCAEKGLVPEFKGTPATHTMVPTILEAHDWAATHADGGQSLINLFRTIPTDAGPVGPRSTTTIGQPRITELSSPGPGRISLTWVTGPGHSGFEVKAGSISVPIDGSTMTASIELPPGEGGEIEVAVRAFKGGTAGKWGRPRKVSVQPRAAGPRPDPNPVGTGSEQPGSTASDAQCWLLKVTDGGKTVTLTKVECPPT